MSMEYCHDCDKAYDTDYPEKLCEHLIKEYLGTKDLEGKS